MATNSPSNASNNNHLQVARSVQFVSLDTHPANNALVLTYEILVTVIDTDTKQELSRRNKRDQLQINVSNLDDLIKANGKINLQDLSEQILRKCPILSSERQKQQQQSSKLLEEIRLHLLYLVNRRKAQMNNPNCKDEGATGPQSRPQSSLLANRNLRSGSRLGQHKRLMSARITSPSINSIIGCDIYGYLLAKESIAGESDELESFLSELDERLSRFFDDNKYTQRPTLERLDQYLEGLYGDTSEKLISINSLRELSKLDESLPIMSSHKLLVCATSRTLRDLSFGQSESDNESVSNLIISESILYCLIRMTSYADTYKLLINSDSQLDTMRVLIDQSGDLVDQLKLNEERLTSNLVDRFYYLLKSLIFPILNMMHSNAQMQRAGEEKKVRKSPFQSEKLIGIVIDLFMLTSKALTMEIKITAATEDDVDRIVTSSSISRPLERLTSLLELLVQVLRFLSTNKEFVTLLKNRAKQTNEFSTCLINLLNTLQLSQPGSGNSSSSGSTIGGRVYALRDQQTLNVIYQLEINIIKLVNNLLHYQYLRTRLIKRNLLKCVLRNLVVFLANKNNGNQTLSSFTRSSVLLTPLKCLYILSCDNSIKGELFKSKIVIKCLLDYLLDEAKKFQDQIDASIKPNEQQVAIVIEPTCAGHYIYAFWTNLTSRPEASSIYNLNSEQPAEGQQQDYTSHLKKQIAEFVTLVIDNLSLYIGLYTNKKLHVDDQQPTKQAQQMIYLQLKIVRNLTQFSKDSIEIQLDEGINKLAQLTCNLLDLPMGTIDCCPIAAESIAIIDNLLEMAWRLRGVSKEGEEGDLDLDLELLPSKQLMSLFEKLVQSDLVSSSLAGGEDFDDLLLVAIKFFGTLCKTKEICPITEEEISSGDNSIQVTGQLIKSKWISMSNHLLDIRLSDTEMLVSCLFSLAHLMNHANFLEALAKDLDFLDSHGSKLEYQLEILVNKLANLLLSGNESLVKLSCLLLDRLRQLEEQQSINESYVYTKRFSVYNDKWLAAIRSSRNQDELSTNGSRLQAAGHIKSPPSSDYSIFGDEFDEDLNVIQGPATLRAVDSQSSSASGGSAELIGSYGRKSNPATGGRQYHSKNTSAARNSELVFDELEEEDNLEENYNDDDDIDDEDDAGSIQSAKLDANSRDQDQAEAEMKRKLICDLNVIDPQSMFKHLVRD